MINHEKNERLMKKYCAMHPFNFLHACKEGDAKVIQAHFEEGKAMKLNENWLYSMPPGFLFPLPLASVVLSDRPECVLLLLEHGADPDIRCRKLNATPRELASAKVTKTIEEFERDKLLRDMIANANDGHLSP